MAADVPTDASTHPTRGDAARFRDEVALLAERGVRRLHVLAWRDRDDIDAGGSEVHADRFMTRCAAAGLDVLQRTSRAQGLPTEAERNGYRIIRAGTRYTVYPRAVLAEVTKRMGPYDALVEVWNGVPWMTPIWCRRPHVVFLHHVHGPMWDQILPRPVAAAGRALETRLGPRLYRRSTVLTPSAATRDDLVALGFRPDRVTAVRNGVDDVFSPGGIRSPTPLVAAVCRLAPVKRLDELIRAAALAKQRVPDLELIIVGEGPLRPALDAQIAELGGRSWISLLGRQRPDDLAALYRRAWIIASASLAEGWGLSLTEAAACGTPAVATDVSGHRSSVIDATTGVLVGLDDLGATIGAVLLDAPLRARLGAAAAERARSLSWDASALGIIRALRAETDARPAGASRSGSVHRG